MSSAASSDLLHGRDASEIWSPELPQVAPGGLHRPRVGIAGISIESSTFSPHISGWEAFTVRRGQQLLDWYPFLRLGCDLREAAESLPLTHARSLPGGAVDREVYEAIKHEIVA